MKKITIIGYGRFGQTLVRLLQDDFEITIYTRHPELVSGTQASKEKMLKQVQHDISKINFTDSLTAAYQNDTIFYAVPMSAFEEVLKEHETYITDHHVLIDVLTVKCHPKKVFTHILKNKKTQALLTHPMFGPDSSKDGFEELPIIIEQFRTNERTYAFWKEYFVAKQLQVIEMSAEEHDHLSANSLGLTHFIGRMLGEYKLKETPIDSLGTKRLLQVKEQVCNDTWELFTDMQHYNPYTKQMRVKFGEIYDGLFNKLIPERIDKAKLTIGIQGGIGSFNEEAIEDYLKQHNIVNAEITYLYTTENVLRELHEGNIDQGVFAMHNATGGIVMESVEAMARHKFAIIEEFAIIISHTLMTRKDIPFEEVTTIMCHPQVLAQCKETLAKKYPHLELTSGEGELIDTALVAKHIAEGKLPKHIATLGSKILADIYDLQKIEENLQDLTENYTSFLLVKRI
ncbi:MAG: prephenate dehydrogenase/arogenate dehydrogenase family protein [Patescibacteria group bacterium]